MNLPTKLPAELTQQQKAWALGIGTASLMAFALLADMWALVLAALSLSVGISLGVMGGAELGRRRKALELDTAWGHYTAAADLVDRLHADNAELNRRAVSVEADLTRCVAENAKLRAQLAEQAGNAA
ncbi:hypothetical protein [Streptosporangium sp. OZ121]|uniref:hypothetical protein n=1 Tax=Streptosporangium sp. OZ121 TaxID=3444183 RepID=UPI003F7AEC43